MSVTKGKQERLKAGNRSSFWCGWQRSGWWLTSDSFFSVANNVQSQWKWTIYRGKLKRNGKSSSLTPEASSLGKLLVEKLLHLVCQPGHWAQGLPLVTLNGSCLIGWLSGYLHLIPASLLHILSPEAGPEQDILFLVGIFSLIRQFQPKSFVNKNQMWAQTFW